MRGESANEPKIMCIAVIVKGKLNPCCESAQRLRRLSPEFSRKKEITMRPAKRVGCGMARMAYATSNGATVTPKRTRLAVMAGSGNM